MLPSRVSGGMLRRIEVLEVKYSPSEESEAFICRESHLQRLSTGVWKYLFINGRVEHVHHHIW